MSAAQSWLSSRCNPCPRWEAARLATTALAVTACRALVATAAAPLKKEKLAARWASIPPAATALAVPATSGRRFKRAARDARWVGIHQLGTASRAGEARSGDLLAGAARRLPAAGPAHWYQHGVPNVAAAELDGAAAGANVGGRRRALLDPVVPIAQQLSPPQPAQGGAANREAAAKGLDLNPGLALGIQILIVHGCLPRRSSQRCRCQSRCERR